MKKTLVIFIIVGLLGWAAYAFWPHKNEHALTYQSITVTRGDLLKSIQASGSVAPQNRVDLRPPFAGRLEEVMVREGDWVKKGQILAWLSSAERAALLDAARAHGPEEVKKWEELYRPTPMLSPISGTLIARSFEPGQGVTATDAVLTVSDRLIIRANVDETDIAQLKVGQEARLTLDAYPDLPFDAKAIHIAYEAKTVSNVTVYEVEVAAKQTPAFMRSGMTASVDFYSEKHPDVLLIPNDAIQARSDAGTKSKGGPKGHGGKGRPGVVLVPGPVTSNGKASSPVEKEIHTGLSDGKNTEVIDGLAEGESILLKTVTLPSAASAGSNPFMPQRPKNVPRGVR